MLQNIKKIAHLNFSLQMCIANNSIKILKLKRLFKMIFELNSLLIQISNYFSTQFYANANPMKIAL